jgi:hypothetical protein
VGWCMDMLLLQQPAIGHMVTVHNRDAYGAICNQVMMV